MRYAVTGATGFLGANLVRHLLSEGHEVLALIRKPNRLLDGLKLDTATPSLLDGPTDALCETLNGCDGIFHVAGTFDPSPGGEDRMRAIHVDATQALLDAARTCSIPRLVLCSSSVTVGFGDASNPGDEDTPLDADRIYGVRGALRTYHDTKAEAERRAATQDGVDAVIVNPDFIVGAYDVKPTSGQSIVALSKRWLPMYPRGGKCFQTAMDCARGHLLAMERGTPGRRYLLGSHNLSYRAFMAVVADVVGQRPPAMPLPRLVTSAAGLVGRLGSRVDAHRFAGLDPHVLRSMQTDRYRSDARARRELGLQPEAIERGIARAHDWFRANGYCA